MNCTLLNVKKLKSCPSDCQAFLWDSTIILPTAAHITVKQITHHLSGVFNEVIICCVEHKDVVKNLLEFFM